MTLYLAEAGVACKWTTGLVIRDPRFFELLDIDMEKEFVVGLFCYGFPKTLPKQSRKDVSDILTETDSASFLSVPRISGRNVKTSRALIPEKPTTSATFAIVPV